MAPSFPAPKAWPYVTLRRPVSMIGLGVLAGLMALRTFNLLLLPMFHDEAIHISRAQSILAEHTLLINTNGGKFLHPWLLALVLPLAEDPLLPARALSAAIGLLAGIGCYLLARQLYQRGDVALVAAALYALDPFSLFHDRMALPDGLQNALVIWSLLFSLAVVRQGRWWQILALGLCLGATIATKISGVLFATFPLLAAWLWRDDFPRRRVWLAVLAAWLLSSIWLLPVGLDIAHQYESTVFHSWVGKGLTGSAYLALLGDNLGLIANALWNYLTPPIVLLALVEVGLGLRRRDKSTWLLALAALITLVFFFLTVNEDFYPRYLLPASPFLLILAARGLVDLADWLWKHAPWPTRHFRWALLAGLFLAANSFAVHFDYLLLTDPPRVAWVGTDRQQYIVGSTAGYGVIDAAAYLRQQAHELGTITVLYAENASWPHSLNQPGIQLGLVDFGMTAQPAFVRKLRQSGTTVFAVLDRPLDDAHAAAFTQGPYAAFCTLVATFPRPGEESRIEVYRIKFSP